MKNKISLSLALFIPAIMLRCSTASEKLIPYLGQEPPGLTPKIFAPDLISTAKEFEFGSVFSKDGREFYYAAEPDRKPEIRMAKFEDGEWSKPVKLIYHDKYGYNDPFLSPDGQKLFFISDQALDGKGDKKDIDIWYVERQGNDWSVPKNAGEKINSGRNEYYISFTENGTLYFSSNKLAVVGNHNNFDIYSSKYENDQFQDAVTLNDSINSAYYEADVFIAPDESYIIYCAERPDGMGKGDLFISFKNENGEWQKAKNLKAVNTAGYEFCPFVTADGKYLFFSREGNIYWVSAEVISSLR